MLARLSRVATDPRGSENPWPELPAVDLGAAALLIRAAWLGDTIRTDTNCPAAGCDEPIDVAFGISEYLAHHRPRRFAGPGRGARAAGSGWQGPRSSFRIPTIGDLLASAREPDGAGWLNERCIRPDGAPGAVAAPHRPCARGVIAPRLDGEVARPLPRMRPHRRTVLRTPQLRARGAARWLERDCTREVHELALAYHWPEQAILALARPRRQRYVAMVRGELAFA